MIRMLRVPWYPGWHAAASKHARCTSTSGGERQRVPGVVEPPEPWALEAGPIASHRTASAVLVRDEAWKIAPKSIALEAGRLAGGGVSPPSAQAYASPSYIWVGPRGAQLSGACWAAGGIGDGSSGLGAVALETTLAVPGSTRERPSAKTQQPPSQVKPALHAGSSPQKRSPELRRINFHPHSHSPTPLRSLTRQAQRSSAQLCSTQPDLDQTRQGQSSPVQSSLHSQRSTSHFHISIHSREMHCCCRHYPSRAVRVLNLYLL